MSKPNNIIITETSSLIYEGLSGIITKSGTPARIIHAGNLNETEKHIITNRQNAIIISPSFIQNSLKLFSTLKNDYPNTKWIALIYAWFDPQIISQFDAVINISDSPDLIISTIEKALRTETIIDSGLNGDILSERETEVLKLLATGLANKEIAEKLNISTNTVITHRKNISQKTGIKSAQGLTIYAVVKKLITLDNIE